MAKKIGIGILIFVVLVLGCVYALAFTDMGNGFVKNKANEIIKEKTGLNAQITRLYLRPSRLEIDAQLDNALLAQIKSDLRLFSLGFDGEFDIRANDLKSISPMLDTKIDLSGKFSGDIDDFTVNADGLVFDKHLRANAHIIGYNPHSIDAQLEPLEISNIFALLSMPAYASGKISFDAKAKDLKDINLNLKITDIIPSEQALRMAFGYDKAGLAKLGIKQNDFRTNLVANLSTSDLSASPLQGQITLQDTAHNYKLSLIPQDLNLSKLQSGSDVRAKLDLNIYKWDLINKLYSQSIPSAKNDGISASIKLDNNYTTANAQVSIKSYFIAPSSKPIAVAHSPSQTNITIPSLTLQNLKKFGFDENVALEASAKLSKALSAKASIKTLDSTITASINDKKINLNAPNINIAKALKAINQPQYLSGKLSLDAKIDDYSALVGTISANADTRVNTALAKKQFGLNLKDAEHITLDANAKLNKDIITFSSQLNSALLVLQTTSGRFDIKSSKLSTNYSAKGVDYARIGALVDRRLRGTSDFDGGIVYDGALLATIHSKNLLDGSLDASFNASNLKAKLSNISAQKLAHTLYIPEIYLGSANGDLDFDVLQNSGSFGFDFGQGRLKQTKLLSVIDVLVNANLANEVIKSAKLNGTINKELIKFGFDASSDRFVLSSRNASANTKSSTLDVPLSLTLKGREWKGMIKGSFDEPKFALDTKDLERQAKEKLKKEIKKETDKHKDKLKQKANDELKKGLGKLFGGR